MRPHQIVTRSLLIGALAALGCGDSGSNGHPGGNPGPSGGDGDTSPNGGPDAGGGAGNGGLGGDGDGNLPPNHDDAGSHGTGGTSDAGTSRDAGSGQLGGCGPQPIGTCQLADAEDFFNCQQTSCDAQWTAVYGNTPAGSGCAELNACKAKCSCDDKNCQLTCATSQTCLDAFAALSQCLSGHSECFSKLPACAFEVAHTCTQLTACCPSLTDPNWRKVCEMNASAGNDSSCSGIYPVFCN
jgi:hypothetical protein